ncbi:hypothetical protein LOTGIDRAFT_171472 [Lottia gigantea]|uniref:Uncharacterized protein n=1 Tax=Lottia gigantea TaxID=225164 RepID=V4AH86_LOTGI|nr:hypothetical protein LOTGIDRAFT_171472 [Lottia gigantea]ESP03384.1 hypothetical protein LOTGIDRAFT_171472 [Lottia gigantea]
MSESENKSPLQDISKGLTGSNKMMELFGDISSSDLESGKSQTEELTGLKRRPESDEVKNFSGDISSGISSLDEATKPSFSNISKSQIREELFGEISFTLSSSKSDETRQPSYPNISKSQIRETLFGDISFSPSSSESDATHQPSFPNISKSQRSADQIKELLGDISFSLSSSESDETTKTSFPNISKSQICSVQIKRLFGDISFSLSSSESDESHKLPSLNKSKITEKLFGDISLSRSESDEANKTSFPNKSQNGHDDFSLSLSSSESDDANKSIHSIIIEKRKELRASKASKSRPTEAFQWDSLSDVESITFVSEPPSPRPYQLFGNVDIPIVKAKRKRVSSKPPDPVLRRESQQFRPDPEQNRFLKSARDRTFGKSTYSKERAKRRKLEDTMAEQKMFEKYLKNINTESSGSDHVPDLEGRWRSRRTKPTIYRKMWFRNLFHKYD